jgi:hypothetical protein
VRVAALKQALAAISALPAWTRLLTSVVVAGPPIPSPTQARNTAAASAEATVTRPKLRSSFRSLALTVTVSPRWPHE